MANLPLDGALHLAFVRSPLAHALIKGIDVAAAAEAPGVVAVFKAADLDLPAHHGLMVVNPDLPRPPLATDRVRFVGEAVAVVVADFVNHIRTGPSTQLDRLLGGWRSSRTRHAQTRADEPNFLAPGELPFLITTERELELR